MLFKLLTAPLTGPLFGLRFVLEQVRTMAERELLDTERIKDELLLLHMRLEEGAISEEEFLRQEAELMARLRAARDLAEKAAQ